MKKFIIAMRVANQSGVLTRISGMFARRGFNIDSLVVGETQDHKFSRVTITMSGDDYERDQIIKQLGKLHDVFEIKEMLPENIVTRELILIKVKTDSVTRRDIMDATDAFRNKVIDFSPNAVCIEMTGETKKVDAFIEIIKPYGIIELCRTGIISMNRGLETLKDE